MINEDSLDSAVITLSYQQLYFRSITVHNLLFLIAKATQ